MKKILPVLLFCFLVSKSFALQSGAAPYGISAKFAGMGGAGSALVDDITSSYYNPAGIVRSGYIGAALNAGTAPESISEIITLISNTSSPAKFFSDNFAKKLNITGNASGLFGLNVMKIGLYFIPASYMTVKKEANSLSGGSISGFIDYDLGATIGYGISIPYIPIANAAVGMNIKYASEVSIVTETVSALQTSSTTETVSGMGFDFGFQGSLNTAFAPIYVGIVIKDFGETLSGTSTTIASNFTTTGGLNDGTPVDKDKEFKAPVTTVLGVASKLPFGKAAYDVEINSAGSIINHLGVEIPALFGFAAVRGGLVSNMNGSSLTTLGAGLFGLNFAYIMDPKNSGNTSFMFDLAMGF